MDINLSKLYILTTWIVSGLIVAYGFYFLYGVFTAGPARESSPTLASISPGAFGPKIGAAANALTNAQYKISLKKKDVSFVDTPLYQSFTDIPVTIPLSDSRGRANPFVPAYP